MHVRRRITQLVASATGGLAVPRLAKIGAAVIAIGLSADLVAHTLVRHVHDELETGFPLDEHLAHFVVVIGMLLVLAGVIADGLRTQRRFARQEGTTRHALR